MSIKLRGKTWHIDVTIKGQTLRQSLRTTDKREALKRSKALEEALWAGLMLPKGPRSQTLQEAFDDHYDLHWSETKDAKGVMARFDTLIRFIPADTPVKDIDQTMVDRLVSDMKKATYTRSKAKDAIRYPYQRATVNRVLALLGTLLSKLEDKGEIDKAPTMPKGEESKRTRFLSEEEESLMFEALAKSDNPNHVRCLRLFTFLTDSGCRMGEAMKLEWADVDFEGRFIVLLDTKSGHDVGKPMTSRALQALADEKASGAASPFDGIGETMYRNAWDYAKAAAGITGKDLVRHSLRHTTASRLVKGGVDLKRVQEFLGHRSYLTTLRYAHLSREALGTAVDVLESVRQTCAATRDLRINTTSGTMSGFVDNQRVTVFPDSSVGRAPDC